MWTHPQTGIRDQTNAIFQKAGASIRLSVLNYDDLNTLGDGQAMPPRQFGDVRYNFIRWETDLDTDSPFLAVTQFQPDPRTGQIISASINVAGAPIKDFAETRIAAYLQKAWGPDANGNPRNPFSDPPPDPSNPSGMLSSSCTVGQTIPVVPAYVQANIYAGSTLYQKMAQYLPPPADGAASPGPSDYVYSHAGDDGATFYKAYFSLIPYTTYADPLMNQFTTTDGSLPQGIQARLTTLSEETHFQQLGEHAGPRGGLAALQLSQSQQGMVDAYNAVDQVRQAWQGHRDYVATWQLPRSPAREDTAQLISLPGTMARSARMCVSINGGPAHWETQDEWETAFLESYEQQTVWHEFGHVMGLEHNFMGSIDKQNGPTYTAHDGTTQFGMNTSSLMEYNTTADRVFWNNGANASNPVNPTNGTKLNAGWLAYDAAAIAFVYGNNLTPSSVGPKAAMPASGQKVGASGVVSPAAPWNDPLGWSTDGTTETQFLFCTHEHIRYTPLCRMFDLGSTPSEITAADIENYEWNYNWRNFRQYYKVWDASSYATLVGDMIGDTRRFLAMDDWDWSPAELIGKLLQVGIDAPAGSQNASLFYNQLTAQFQADVGAAEELVAAFHEGLIQQSTGQRPYQSQFDPYYGDVTQQGIAVDKELAFINWLGLWPYDNYDPTQAAGFFSSSMVTGPGITQPSQAWSTAGSMLGEKGPWDAYPQFFPAAVSLFAHDTQSPTFTTLGYPPDARTGSAATRSLASRTRCTYFQNIAVQNRRVARICRSAARTTWRAARRITSRPARTIR